MATENHKRFDRILTWSLMFPLLVALIGSEYWQVASSTRSVVDGIKQQITSRSDFPWLSVVFPLTVFSALIFVQLKCLIHLQRSRAIDYSQVVNSYAKLGLIVLLQIFLIQNYYLHYTIIQSSFDLQVWLWGLTFGQGIVTWKLWNAKKGSAQASGSFETILVPLIIVLVLASQFHPDWSQWNQLYQYREITRWTGPCRNPNHFGMLMGIGLILTMGQARSVFNRSRRLAQSDNLPSSRSQTTNIREFSTYNKVELLLYVVAICMLFAALVKSYSRGAWLGTLISVGYLAFSHWKRNKIISEATVSPKKAFPSGLFKLPAWCENYIGKLAIMSVALFLLCFWTLRDSNVPVVRRAFSVSNVNDLSWRNRVEATIGALQMNSDQPVSGVGWGQPESHYNEYYRKSKVTEGLAIILNCYLNIGMVLGLPALICFSGYLWLGFVRKTSNCFSVSGSLDPEPKQFKGSRIGIPGLNDHPVWVKGWLNTVCKAAVIVMLISFWFDRGLFMLALAGPFWILLELATNDFSPANNTNSPAQSGQTKQPPAPIASKGFCRGTEFLRGHTPKWIVPLLALAAFFTAMIWARDQDPFEKHRFNLPLESGGELQGMAVIPKPFAQYPIVVYLYDSGSSVLNSGFILRQIGELGLGAVAIEYNADNQDIFNSEFLGLHRYLEKQPWALPGAVAWVGSGSGAQKMLQFLISHQEIRPKTVVALEGGLQPRAVPARTDQLPSMEAQASSLVLTNIPVLIVRGEKDEWFLESHGQDSAVQLRGKGADVSVRTFPQLGRSFYTEYPYTMRMIAEYCGRGLISADDTTGPGKPQMNPTQAPARTYKALSHPKSAAFLLGFTVTCLCAAFFLKTIARRSSNLLISNVSSEKPAHKGLKTAFNLSTMGLAGCAIIITAINLLLPQLQFRAWTAPLVNRFLISPDQQQNLKFITESADYSNETIATLLDYIKLTSLQSAHFYKNLEQPLFHQYVLSPVVDAKLPGEINWRRTFWEEFYPRIRKHRDPEIAGKIIIEHLRRKIGVDPLGPSLTGIETTWRRQATDARGFDRIYVAALRSVGIAARLNGLEKPELWTGKDWVDAPRLPLMDLN